MAHLSPRTKCRVVHIGNFKKASVRSRRMVMAKMEMPREILKEKKLSLADNAVETFQTPTDAGRRPLKRSREDHAFVEHTEHRDISQSPVFQENGSCSVGAERELLKHILSAVHDDDFRHEIVIGESGPFKHGNASPKRGEGREGMPPGEQQPSPVRLETMMSSTKKKSPRQNIVAKDVEVLLLIPPALQLEHIPPLVSLDSKLPERSPTSSKSSNCPSRCSPFMLANGFSEKTSPGPIAVKSPHWSPSNWQPGASELCAPTTIGDHGLSHRVMSDVPVILAETCTISNAVDSPTLYCQQVELRDSQHSLENLVESLEGSPEISRGICGTSPCDRVVHDPETNECSPLQRKALYKPHRRSRSPENFAPPYFHGLRNLGNTCYMNAVIQLLYHMNCFIEDISSLQLSYEELMAGDRVYFALRRLVNDLHRAPDHSICDARNFLQVCEENMRDFIGTVQQDAQEFFFNLVNHIDDEISSYRKEHPDNMFSTTRNFSCQVRNTLSCQECGQNRNVEQRSCFFSLPLPDESRKSQAGSPDIEDMLDLFFQAETASVNCPKCGASTVKSETSVIQIPRVLALHINRFAYDNNCVCSKLSSPVKFRQTLDIGTWCSNNFRGPDFEESSEGAPENSADAGCCKTLQANGVHKEIVVPRYDLYGVLSHAGKLADSGHYTADIHDARSNKWIRCDDSSVREVLADDVLSDEKGEEAYMLLYILSD